VAVALACAVVGISFVVPGSVLVAGVVTSFDASEDILLGKDSMAVAFFVASTCFDSVGTTVDTRPAMVVCIMTCFDPVLGNCAVTCSGPMKHSGYDYAYNLTKPTR
jgi:hypothetical protein